MNYTQRRGTTKAKVSVPAFNQAKELFLLEVFDVVAMNEIPIHLIFNWDQTGLNLVPVSSWTMTSKESKCVEIQSLADKRQITCVFCGTLLAEFLPPQLIYSGKRDRCLPTFKFPEDWLISHTQSQWSNKSTMISYIEEVIVPFLEKKREQINVDQDQSTLAIFDCFKGQLTEKVCQYLEENDIHSVLIPPNCTDRLQPLDISVNKAVKDFLHTEFQNWYANEVAKQYLESDNDQDTAPIDLSTARMKFHGVNG
uniref:DDE-1 domain-containing protein n=1 Tax=Amphimedon queenslandica TaxID=400682 RepID=A0A1X7VDC2_AMPQE